MYTYSLRNRPISFCILAYSSLCVRPLNDGGFLICSNGFPASHSPPPPVRSQSCQRVTGVARCGHWSGRSGQVRSGQVRCGHWSGIALCCDSSSGGFRLHQYRPPAAQCGHPMCRSIRQYGAPPAPTACTERGTPPPPPHPTPLTPLHLHPARSGPAQPSPAQPGPVRPNPAQPSPVRPGPARPGPAQTVNMGAVVETEQNMPKQHVRTQRPGM